jgi:uncharacterized protein YbjQ (UPF0145 family)
MDQLIFLIILVGVGYTAGTIAEKRHYQSIEKRENKFLKLPVVTLKDAFDKDSPILRTRLVLGSAVISIDYFKRMLAAFRNIVGGELKGYTELLQDSRNQAVERMTQQAKQLGANAVVNIRFATSSVAQGASELYVYGTAVRVE